MLKSCAHPGPESTSVLYKTANRELSSKTNGKNWATTEKQKQKALAPAASSEEHLQF